MDLRLNRTKRHAWVTLGLGFALAVAFVLIAVVSTRATASPMADATAKPKPTIVLVHGAWANTASWSGVIERLEAEGYTVYAPPNPLHSLQGDAESIADFLHTIKGPVVLVGHSYGGAVITNAANYASNVKALVYVDAFAPAQGESAFQLTAKFPGSVLTSAAQSEVFRAVAYPGDPKSDPTVYVNPTYFTEGFANDLSAKAGAVALATQDPVALAAVTAPSGRPAWKHIPSWYAIGSIDKAIPPATQLFMAKRAGSHITMIPGAGHLSMVSHPAAVTKVITEAAQAVG
jgi:pimeloyl-ACP methyl ester carboxylesterase